MAMGSGAVDDGHFCCCPTALNSLLSCRPGLMSFSYAVAYTVADPLTKLPTAAGQVLGAALAAADAGQAPKLVLPVLLASSQTAVVADFSQGEASCAKSVYCVVMGSWVLLVLLASQCWQAAAVPGITDQLVHQAAASGTPAVVQQQPTLDPHIIQQPFGNDRLPQQGQPSF